MADLQQGQLVTSGGTPIRGSGSLQDQTTAALQTQSNVVKNPTFASPDAIPMGSTSYIDKYGRIAVGQTDDQGNIIVRQATLPTPKLVAPTTPATPTLNPTLSLPGATPTPPSQITPNQTIPNQDPTTTLSLKNTAGLLGIVRLGNDALDLAGSGVNSSLLNTGLLGGINDAIDQFGAMNIPGFTTFGANPGWTYNVDTGFNELTNPDLVGTGVGETSLTSSLGYGSAGSFVAGLLGLSSGNFLEDTATGLAGGVIGGSIGGSIGGTLLGIGAGALGGFIGGFALTALASLFGPRPSDQLAGGTYHTGSQSVESTWTFQGKKYSAANNNNRDQFFDYVKTLQNNLTTAFGVSVPDIPISLDLGRYTGVAVSVSDESTKQGPAGGSYNGVPGTGRQNFQNGQAALEYVGKLMMQNASTPNGNPDIEQVRSTLDWKNVSFNDAVGAFGFAKDYRTTANDFLKGDFNIDQNKDDSLQTIDTWASKAKQLFTDDANSAFIDQATTAAKAKIFNYFNNPAPTT